MVAFGSNVFISVCVLRFAFSSSFFFFFFLLYAFQTFSRQSVLLSTVYALLGTIHRTHNHFIGKKIYIKNGSHGIIYIFKNYFATVFSVFSFQQNKLYPNGPLYMNITYNACAIHNLEGRI